MENLRGASRDLLWFVEPFACGQAGKTIADSRATTLYPFELGQFESCSVKTGLQLIGARGSM